MASFDFQITTRPNTNLQLRTNDRMRQHQSANTFAQTLKRSRVSGSLRNTRRLMLTVVASLTLAAWVMPKEADAAEQPDIIVILADDLGYGDLSSFGGPNLKTPHIDRLVADGMKFTEAYANCPVCSPTRASLLTGLYPDLAGVPGVIRTHPENSWGWLSPDATLLPEILKPVGYHTGIVGKWHLGLSAPNTPNGRGFDEFHGYLGDMMDDYYTHRRHGINYMRHNDEEIDPKGHATDLFTEWSVDFIRKAPSDKPYFLYLAYNAPHTPIQPPKDWLEKIKAREPDISDQRARLIALIEHMDDGIGRVMKGLESADRDRETLIVFTSDNGGQLNVGAFNGPLRDGKQSVYEGGLKVPMCVTWKNHIESGSATKMRVLSMDIFATVAELAGAKVPAGIDGRSFAPTLMGKEQPELRRDWFFRRREGGQRYAGKTIEAVRRGRWKLLQNSPFAPRELYDLESDPLEENNVISQQPKIANELSKALSREFQRYGSVPWQAPLDD